MYTNRNLWHYDIPGHLLSEPLRFPAGMQLLPKLLHVGSSRVGVLILWFVAEVRGVCLGRGYFELQNNASHFEEKEYH